MAFLRTVAVVGAGGHLGKEVGRALLSSTFRASYANVVFLRRQSTEESGKESIDGAQLRFYKDDTLSQALQGVDVLISTVGPAGHDFKDVLIDAIAGSNVKLYIPSEFGVDHTIHDFPHAEWGRKKDHHEKAVAVIPTTKVCRIYNGLFIEDSIGPWYGLSVEHGIFESIGSPDKLISFTALRDVGNVVAQIARTPIKEIPECLHISGDALTIRQLGAAMEHAGSSLIQIKESDLNDFKQKTLAEGTHDPSKYLRFLMGEGKIDHTMSGLKNDNELVNPSQRNWRWKTVAEYAKETGGRPWFGSNWSADAIK